jgi:hypothetical protein
MNIEHQFKIGQIVELLPTTLRASAPGTYEIVRLIPMESGPPRYCLKSQKEKHERVVTEHDLVLVTEPADS